ncbi:heterokaryon incompatibility protein-domain-containing protein [Hyaloscypha finlandica]|nr:heterokaryon incompatibility protein-domain-containing protein [Hyaloscypha finlandica]
MGIGSACTKFKAPWPQLRLSFVRVVNQDRAACRGCYWDYSVLYSTLTSVAHAKGSGAAAIFSSQIVGVEDSTILAVSDDPDHSLERRSFAIQPKSPVETPNCITSSIRDTSAGIDWQVIRSWLEFCSMHHTLRCDVPRGITRGFSVIDCDAHCVVPLPTEDVPYCTLSYAWDSDKGEEITDDGNLPVLPRTISDALCAVKSLGFKYLWVDRYSVPQDNFPDKHRLIRMMGEIYRNSTLTLIAAAGQGPDHGLPGISPGLRKAEKPLDVGDWTLVHHETNLEEEIKSSRRNSRAWTYQEALLSYRRLVFTESQTYFQCQSMHCLESISIPLSKLHTPGFQDMISTSLPRIFPSQGVGEDYYRSFYDRITEYTQRELSYHKDALLAFQGVMQEF